MFVAPSDSLTLQDRCWHNTVQNNKGSKYTGTLPCLVAAQQVKHTKNSNSVCKSSPHYKKTIFPLSHTLNIMKNEMVYTYVSLAVFMAHKDSERFFPIIRFRQESIKFSLPQQWRVVMTLISCVWNQKLAGGTTIQNSNYSRRALWTAQLIFKMSIPGSCQAFLWWKQGLKTQFGGFRIIKKNRLLPLER